MGVRTLARQRALQLLFALEVASGEDAAFANAERRFMAMDVRHRRGWGPFARALAATTWEERERLDPAIMAALIGWTFDRLPLIDRICLRMGLCEMRHFPDIPLRVTINEYIELARYFSSNESPQFINAVLDRLAERFRKKDFKTGEDAVADLNPEDMGELEIADDPDDEAEAPPPPPRRKPRPSF